MWTQTSVMWWSVISYFLFIANSFFALSWRSLTLKIPWKCLFICAGLEGKRGIFHLVFHLDVHLKKADRLKNFSRKTEMQVHSFPWGTVPAERWMSSFRQLESEQSWDRKVLVSCLHSSKAGFSSFLSALSALRSSTLHSAGSSLHKPAWSWPEAEHMPSPCSSVRVTEESVEDKSASGLCRKSRSSDFVQKKVDSSNPTYVSVKNKQICINNLYFASSGATL